MLAARMTTEDIAALDRALPVVAPFAAVEQHGPHLPLATDAMITSGIVAEMERMAPETFLALPVAEVGASAHHMPFAGTLSLQSSTFLAVARDLVECCRAHGFRRFLLLNGHGGNQALLNVAVQEIAAARPELRVVHATYWSIASEAFAEIRESAAGGMGHACEMETSVMLALHPELVRRDRMAPGGFPPRTRLDGRDMLEPGPIGQFRWWNAMSENGVLGDPTSASAEKGRRFLEAAARAALEVVEALRADRAG